MRVPRKGWTPSDLVEVLSAHVNDAGGIRAWCRTHGREFSVSFVCDVLRGRREMTARLAAALGFVQEPVTYRRAPGGGE